MSAGLIAATAIKGGIDLAKMISGWVGAAKGRKELNSLLANRPEYKISQGYLDAFKTYQTLANQEMPGFQQMKDMGEQSSARTMYAAERGAMGSGQLMDVLNKNQAGQFDFIRNLGIASAQWKAQQKQNLAGAQSQMGQLQDVQFQQNVLDPWNIKANMAGERMSAGRQQAWGGAQDLASTAMNYAGTNYYQKMMAGLYGDKNPQQPQRYLSEIPTPTVSNPYESGLFGKQQIAK